MPLVPRNVLTAAFAMTAAMWLAGCATVAHTPMTKESSAKLSAKKVAVVNYTAADFVPFTADKAAFGAIGAGLMIAAGKELVASNGLPDPAIAVREQLIQSVVERRGVSVVVVDSSKPTESDDIAALVAAHPGADYLLDVKTLNNMISYYPANWAGYRYAYSARVRVIETASKAVLAETLCSTVQGDDAKPPTYDQLLADQATLLKSYMSKASTTCADLIAKDLLQLHT